MATRLQLPPGQHASKDFPRFGTHLHHPPPPIPDDPAIEISGAGVEPFSVRLADLRTLPRRELVADFHCVAGWSALDLEWEGVPFAAFYRQLIEPALPAGTTVTHLGFRGLDRYRSVVMLEDALDEEVLIADRLAGRRLDSDHGAPVRLVSPKQYGYINTKHLCRIELHTSAPVPNYTELGLFRRLGLNNPLIQVHPRARVAEEERHRYLPGKLLRPIYRVLVPPFRFLSARGSRSQHDDDG